MQYVSWFLSFLLHATLLVVLFQTIHLTPLTLEDVMKVDLTEMEVPKEVAPMPVPQPIPELPLEVAEPAGNITPTPLPQDKTIVLDDSPPAPEPPVIEQTPLPAPEPEVIEISPVKTDELTKDTPKQVIVRKDDTIVHRGHEARFGRAMMGDYYSYASTEFSGNFKARDDRTISIIDARNTKYGRFLIYDSKNKTLRRLKQGFGKYVYTIGPSVYADEPVYGTVTFLAKNDRIERFILMTDDDRIAHFPRKVHVREDSISFPTRGVELKGQTSLPPAGENHPGVVFVHGNQCVEPGLVLGFTRALAMHNLASLSFENRGCNGAEGTPDTEEQLVADTGAALDYLTSLPQIGNTRTGLWGNGRGAPIAVNTALHPGKVKPTYLICLLDDSMELDAMPKHDELAALTMPTLWIITGQNTAKWHPFITTLENLRDRQKKTFSIVVAPSKASKDVLDAKTDLSEWVENVTEDHARLAVSWIQHLDN